MSRKTQHAQARPASMSESTQYAQLLTDEEHMHMQTTNIISNRISTGVPVLASTVTGQPISQSSASSDEPIAIAVASAEPVALATTANGDPIVMAKTANGEPIVMAKTADGQSVMLVAAASGQQPANGQPVMRMAAAPGQQPAATVNGQAVVLLVAAPTVGGQQPAAVPGATATPMRQPMKVAVEEQPAEQRRAPRDNLRPGPLRKGLLMKKPVDGLGFSSHRTFVLFADKIAWYHGDKPRGVLVLDPTTHVKYAPSALLLSITTGDRELQLYPRDKKEEGAEEEMRAWFAAVEEVVSAIKVRYLEWRAQNPAPIHYYDGRGGYYRRYSDDWDGADAALCVGTGLLAGCCIGGMLF